MELLNSNGYSCSKQPVAMSVKGILYSAWKFSNHYQHSRNIPPTPTSLRPLPPLFEHMSTAFLRKEENSAFENVDLRVSVVEY